MVEAELTRAAGFAERLAAVELVPERAGPRPITVSADKSYNTGDFVMRLRQLGAVPHVVQHTTDRRSAIDRRTTQHAGYHLSEQARHRIEELFAWVQTIAGQPKTSPPGLNRALAFQPRHGLLQLDPPAQAPGRPVVVHRRMGGAGSRPVNNSSRTLSEDAPDVAFLESDRRTRQFVSSRLLEAPFPRRRLPLRVFQNDSVGTKKLDIKRDRLARDGNITRWSLCEE